IARSRARGLDRGAARRAERRRQNGANRLRAVHPPCRWVTVRSSRKRYGFVAAPTAAAFPFVTPFEIATATPETQPPRLHRALHFRPHRRTVIFPAADLLVAPRMAESWRHGAMAPAFRERVSEVGRRMRVEGWARRGKAKERWNMPVGRPRSGRFS